MSNAIKTKKRCMYSECSRPDENCRFYRIDGTSGAGGRDWSGLGGKLLCQSCYDSFLRRGTLERPDRDYTPLPASQKRCSYSGCERPDMSAHFYRVEDHCKAGGQDWSALADSVLCEACYQRYLRRGTLERSDRNNKPLPSNERKCTYADCARPGESKKFHRIYGDSTAGGQDWSALADSVLCGACYSQFRKRGTLERSQAVPSGEAEGVKSRKRPNPKAAEGAAGGGEGEVGSSNGSSSSQGSGAARKKAK